jgi:hypothetical protein
MSPKKKPSSVTLVVPHPSCAMSPEDDSPPVTSEVSRPPRPVQKAADTKITTSTKFNCVTYDTTDQEVIRTTIDHARLLVRDYTDRLKASSDFVLPLELLISLSVTLLTTSFRDFGLKAEIWCAIFYLIDVASFVWLIVALVRRRRAPKIEDLVRALKGAQGNRV